VPESELGKDSPSLSVQWTRSAASQSGVGNEPGTVEMGRDETPTTASYTLAQTDTDINIHLYW